MSSSVAPDLAPLAAMVLQDPDGAPVHLGSLWEQRKLVLVFVRHFGWMFCREQVAQLRDHRDAIRAKGGDLAVVGNGTPKQAAGFRAEQRLEFPLLVDPGLAAYKAAGMKRTVLSVMNPLVLARGVRALTGGFSQGSTQGDPWQQGGAFVIHPPGEVRYAFVSGSAGEHPPVEDLLAAL